MSDSNVTVSDQKDSELKFLAVNDEKDVITITFNNAFAAAVTDRSAIDIPNALALSIANTIFAAHKYRTGDFDRFSCASPFDITAAARLCSHTLTPDLLRSLKMDDRKFYMLKEIRLEFSNEEIKNLNDWLANRETSTVLFKKLLRSFADLLSNQDGIQSVASDVKDLGEVRIPVLGADASNEIRIPVFGGNASSKVRIPFSDGNASNEVRIPFSEGNASNEVRIPFSEGNASNEVRIPFSEGNASSGVPLSFSEEELKGLLCGPIKDRIRKTFKSLVEGELERMFGSSDDNKDHKNAQRTFSPEETTLMKWVVRRKLNWRVDERIKELLSLLDFEVIKMLYDSKAP